MTLDDLAVPSTLTINSVNKFEHVVLGGDDGHLMIAVFASITAAEHFVRYCVEQQKTFAGVRP